MLTLKNFSNLQVTVASGKQNFPMSRGSFKYKDKIHNKKKLIVKEVSASTENIKILNLFTKKNTSLGSVTIKDDNGTITLTTNINDKSINRIWITLPFSEKHYYGCGETFSKFDLAGEKVRIWVAEHQNAKRITKKIILWKLRGPRPNKVSKFSDYESYFVEPTFVTNKKWTLHLNTSSYSEFDFSKKDKIIIQIRENATFTFLQAATYTELSKKLSELIGYQRPLPEWVYDGAILSLQTGPAFINKTLQEAEANNLRITGVWSQDWCGCRKTGFGYQVMWNWQQDKELYPNLENEIQKWKNNGIHFLGYINPFIALEKNLYKEAHQKGYCVKNKNGEDYLVKITTFPASMVDFTNPEAYEWYKNLIKKNMIGIGMSGWMADFGEYLPPDAVLFSGENAEIVHNKWPGIWAKLNREAIEECGKQGEVFFFTRAGYTNTIKNSTMMWNGDQHVDWSCDDGLPSVIPATLSLSMSGYTLTHSDAGGYTTIMQMTRSKELLMRWLEMNIFSPLLRTHEGNQPARNIQAYSSEELIKYTAYCSRLHLAIKPYLLEAQNEACKNGTPVIRPLFYYYDEEEAYKENYEYLLGRELLVSPVLEENANEKTVYLPDDTWIHLWTKKEYSGGKYTVASPIGKPPVFIRKDAYNKKELEELLNFGQDNI